MKNKHKLCVICSCNLENVSKECTEFEREKQGEEEERETSLSDDPVNTKNEESNLMNVFNLLVKSSPHCNHNSELETRFKTLENANYSLCLECNSITGVALESMSRAEKMESEVRILQIQLLELLRGLQVEMEVFNGEMSKISGVVRGSESAPCWSDGSLENTEEALVVREEILEVVTDLRFYQADLQDKLVVNRMEDQSMLEVSTAVEVDFESGLDSDLKEDDNEDIMCFIGEVGYDDEMDFEEEEEEDHKETLETEEEEGEKQVSEPNMLYVGHMIGLKSTNKLEKSKHRNLRRRLGFGMGNDDHECTVCGDRLPTQNKLTRHLRVTHGLVGRWTKPKLPKPAERFNSKGLSQEMLSKALGLLNDKTGEERKRARKKKVPKEISKTQWKILKKSIKQQRKSKMEPLKVPPKRLRQVSKKTKKLTKKSGVFSRKKVAKEVAAPVPVPTKLIEETESKQIEVEDAKPIVVKVKENKESAGPPLRRSTRGQGVLDIKDIVLNFLGGKGKKTNKQSQQITEKET